jgi:prevent-host-death family protein
VRVEVGVRQLRENLAEWLDRAAAGDEIVVTERGTPKVVITAATGEAILERLIREGRADPATRPRRRTLPPPIPVSGNPVTDEILRARGYDIG